jgi:hypothetical protein
MKQMFQSTVLFNLRGDRRISWRHSRALFWNRVVQACSKRGELTAAWIVVVTFVAAVSLVPSEQAGATHPAGIVDVAQRRVKFPSTMHNLFIEAPYNTDLQLTFNLETP